MFKWKIVGNIAAIALLGGVLGYYNFVDKAPEAGAKVGDKCPEFTAQLFQVEGDTFSLSEETFRISMKIGKVCVLNFWEYYCVPCVNELPEFNEIYEEYEGEVEVIAMAGTASTASYLENWMTTKSWETYNPHYDWADFSLTFGYLSLEDSQRLGHRGPLPMTVIVDKSGIISYTTEGPMTYESLKAEIEKVL